MLQNGFFSVKPFNPSPYWNNVLVNLSGSQKFDANTVFYPGRYKVKINAGSASRYTDGTRVYVGYPVVIERNIIVRQRFIIRAYCGDKSVAERNGNSFSVLVGTNPYSGGFKVNGLSDHTIAPSYVSHIFGNAGSAGYFCNSSGVPIPVNVASSGNCLGDGVSFGNSNASSAGSCLHIVPVGGVFGTDYLFAFHCAGVAGSYYDYISGGNGSAYGGAASGDVRQGQLSTPPSTQNGGSTPYGTGGAGVSGTSDGNAGTGIGAGRVDNLGAGAWFNGVSWENVVEHLSEETPGTIKVEYLGPLN